MSFPFGKAFFGRCYVSFWGVQVLVHWFMLIVEPLAYPGFLHLSDRSTVAYSWPMASWCWFVESFMGWVLYLPCWEWRLMCPPEVSKGFTTCLKIPEIQRFHHQVLLKIMQSLYHVNQVLGIWSTGSQLMTSQLRCHCWPTTWKRIVV